MTVSNRAKLIRREILAKTCRIYINDEPLREIDRIPINMRPKSDQLVRCCVHSERAVIKYKMMAMLGFDSKQEEDELKPLRAYFDEHIRSLQPESFLLSVTDEACSACQQNNYIVTNMCRGCVGRPCSVNCPKDAVVFENDKAKINEDQCVSCGLCEKVCPFHAIIYSPVPCENVCPVKAISKDEQGKEHIDPDKCILCGKCLDVCPFGAVVEKSHLFRVVSEVKNKKEVVAMVAPALAGQFREPMGRIMNSIKQLGFTRVVEVAEGANITSKHEAREFLEKAEHGNSMTTSCCPAYVQLIDKHHPELKPYVSETLSPMKYTSELVSKKYPQATQVFIGPCIGKKAEAENYAPIQYVLNFEEIGAWLVSKGIEVAAISNDYAFDKSISATARNYATSGGVSAAVFSEIGEHPYGNEQFDGIDKHFPRKLKQTLKDKHPKLIEVMACEGGCIGGCSNIVDQRGGKRQLAKFVADFKK